MTEQLKKDLVTLMIEEGQALTSKYVTIKYKKLAKDRHPDREGGSTEEFQELQNAYRRVINYIEETEGVNLEEEDFEKDFFMQHNVMKECSRSFVVYVQDMYVDKWRVVLEKHLTVRRRDKGRYIFKTGNITITLYDKPKKDPRSKLHIQSGDQIVNLNFILDKLSLFYREVCTLQNKASPALEVKQRSMCPKCKKMFTNIKGVKQHIIRMHGQKSKKEESMVDKVTLMESSEVLPSTQEEPTVMNSFTNSRNKVSVEHVIKPNVVDITLEESVPSVDAETINSRGKVGVIDEHRMDEFLIDMMLTSVFPEEDEQETEETETNANKIGNESLSESNYQCGVCGKLYQTELDIDRHIKNDHEEQNDSQNFCKHKERNIQLEKTIEDKEKELSEVAIQNEYIVRKNMQMDKELKRMKLAFNESQRQKAAVTKELDNQRESLTAAIKENTVLNEEVKIKAEFIKGMMEKNNENENQDLNPHDIFVERMRQESDSSERTENVEESSKANEDSANTHDPVQTNTEDVIEKAKCKECEYKTSKPR